MGIMLTHALLWKAIETCARLKSVRFQVTGLLCPTNTLCRKRLQKSACVFAPPRFDWEISSTTRPSVQLRSRISRPRLETLTFGPAILYLYPSMIFYSVFKISYYHMRSIYINI
ncbi:hypothetical protein BGX38DRAFT_693959 [Terfezia claveryi]|nr:hypothetical protein BGX38DRAFT_693959 [Terfezia claveryi]